MDQVALLVDKPPEISAHHGLGQARLIGLEHQSPDQDLQRLGPEVVVLEEARIRTRASDHRVIKEALRACGVPK